jgi:spermidine/putrescine transport system permease protein
VSAVAATRRAAPRPSAGARLRSFAGRHLVTVLGSLALAYILLPIVIVVLLSFNRPQSRYTYTFHEFTFDNWTHMCSVSGMCDSLGLSLRIAAVSTAGATVLGTLLALALARHRFRGRAATNLLVVLPMTMPEVVLGASLLTLFVNLNMRLGFTTIVIAHVMFCLSFVVVTVRARLAGLDARLEEAAMDLYATRWRVFRRVTLPLALPGIVAAALLSFALSFDDFVITNFNSGSEVTFPMFVWGAARRGVPVQVNVIATLMFLGAVLVAFVAMLATRRREPSA